MSNFLKTFVVSAFMVAAATTVNYGYGLLMQQLRTLADQSYGTLGAQLQQDTACADVQCPQYQAAQDMQNINKELQKALRAQSHPDRH